MTNAVWTLWSMILEKAAPSFKKLDLTSVVENELLDPTNGRLRHEDDHWHCRSRTALTCKTVT